MSHLKYGLDRPRLSQVSRLSCRAFSLSLLAMTLASLTFHAQAEISFNPHFLSDDPSLVADLSSFETGQELPPGTYRTDIYLNDSYINTRDVTYEADDNNQGLFPCMTRGQLSSMGINTAAIPGMAVLAANACVPITTLIKGSTVNFDAGDQRLSLTIPQALMSNKARGYISPELWDEGITAGLLNYNFTGNNVRSSIGGNSKYAYLSLQSGINLGAWRLRDNTNWSYRSGGSSTKENKWQHVNTWLERSIARLSSRLTLGDSFTNGDIFNSINFRGIQLASDDNMLPDSQKGFAPVINGIAKGTAQVIVKQNGYEIYNNTVPPGPFTINDLYATGSGGDLQVTVREADGSAQVFTVPYSSLPVLQREGYTRYAVTAGEYRSGNQQQDRPKLFQGTLLRGLRDGWTVFSGTQLSNRYRALNIGLGKNLGILGAFSFDITLANATLADASKHQGQSLRFLYNKSLSDIGTNIQLVGYRYSTRGYYDFSDTTYSRMRGYSVLTEDGVVQVNPKFSDYYNLAYSKRGKLQLSLSQQIGRTSTLYVSGSHQTYWGTKKADEQLQVGLNSAIEDINWNLSYSLTKSAWQEGRDQMLAFNMNIPFSHWLRSDNTTAWQHASASYSVTNDLNGRTTNLAGLYGTLLEDNNLNYSVQTGYAGGGRGSSSTGYATMNYRGGYANSNVGYSQANGMKQLYYGFSGGVLAHADGVTFSQPLNDTVVLVKAPGAGNVRVENQTGVTTDWRGYAVLPYATEYRENRVALDTNTLADNVELDDAVATAIPTRGAVVRAEFKAHVGMKILMSLIYKGKPIPFGAVVTSKDSQSSSIVGDNGQVFLTGMPMAGKVLAKWGEGTGASCEAYYSLPPESENNMMSQLSAECQ